MAYKYLQQQDDLQHSEGYKAVSYTHLDVYKRQVQMAEALKKAVPDKKEHPVRISIITLILAYKMCIRDRWYKEVI